MICWCVVGTTTCASRSVQIWVTLKGGDEETKDGTSNMNGHVHSIPHPPFHTDSDIVPSPHPQTTRIQSRPRPRGRWMYTSRRWDWKEVGVKCLLPAGIVYFMAWLGELRMLSPCAVSFLLCQLHSSLGPSSPVRFIRPNTRLTVSWGAIYELVTAYPTFPLSLLLSGAPLQLPSRYT